MRRTLPMVLLVLVIAGVVTAFHIVEGQQNVSHAQTGGRTPTTPTGHISVASSAYLYYTLKQSTGFVLARAARGANGQPVSSLQTVATFPNRFGVSEADSVFTMQLSPDGRYLAIDGSGDHGEQVWTYDTQRMTIQPQPAYVMGNFLHWLPGGNGHMFLYRPMFPLGPSAPLDGGTWNPGLWEVDAATGGHININIQVPSAFLIDASASPDSSRIVYSTTAGVGLGSDTWLMNSDGSNRFHIMRTPTGAQSIAAFFTWSPDNSMVAYEMLSDSSTPFLPAGLWVMNNTGQGHAIWPMPMAGMAMHLSGRPIVRRSPLLRAPTSEIAMLICRHRLSRRL